MKLNGALKPRQGASKQGCSPGVVFKEYRAKRYFEVNKNVVNGLPHIARGVKHKDSFYKKVVINSNYNSINDQQRAITSLPHQLEHKENYSEGSSKKISGNVISRINSSTSTTAIKQNNTPTQVDFAQSRVAGLTKTNVCRNYSNNRKKKNNFVQKVTVKMAYNKTLAAAAAAAAAAAVAVALAETNTVTQKNTKSKINVQKDSEPKAVINITTRQIGKTKLKEKRNKNNYTKRNRKKTKQLKNLAFEAKSHNNTNNDNPEKVNKILFVPKINESSNLKASVVWLSTELKEIFFSIFLHVISQFLNFTHYAVSAVSSRNAANICSRAVRNYCIRFRLVNYNLVKMMSTSQLLIGLFKSISLKNAKGAKSPIALFMVIYAATAILLPHAVVGDDVDTFFPINGIETTTPEFDYASRGQKKFGDKCENTLECGFPGSICDPKKKSCQCTEDLPVTNHIDKCGKEAAVNESCFFNEQCEVKYFQTECRDQRCVCRFDMTPIWLKDGSVECKGRGDKKGPETYIDPAMIGVLIGMALMFIIICVVLRLFSQARWRENRTIFNTPNPRLMNVSLLRESKLLHGQERRGSRMSVRAPSRQPSMTSLRPHSPNPSLGKTGRMTRSKSNTRSSDSRVSDASNCSRLLEHHAATTHHASHSHAYAISPQSSSTNHGAQTSVLPISLNAPTTATASTNETTVAETTDSNTNLPTTKTNKF